MVVVPADLMSRGGANELLTLNGASGSDSGVSDRSMSPFVLRMDTKKKAEEDRKSALEVAGIIGRLQKTEKHRGAPISSRAGLLLPYRADHMTVSMRQNCEA